jgi:hypothetical protein
VPSFSRQDGPLSEKTYPLRLKKEASRKAVLWSQEDKENIPPIYAEKTHPKPNESKEERYDD